MINRRNFLKGFAVTTGGILMPTLASAFDPSLENMVKNSNINSKTLEDIVNGDLSIRDPIDLNTQEFLEQMISSMYKRGVLSYEEIISVLFSNMRTGKDYANIGAEEVLPGASMQKIPISLAYTILSLKDRASGKTKFVFNDDGSLIEVDLTKGFQCVPGGGRAKVRSAINYGGNIEAINLSNQCTDEFLGIMGVPRTVDEVICREYPELRGRISTVEKIEGGETYENKISLTAMRDLMSHIITERNIWTEVVRTRARDYGERVRFESIPEIDTMSRIYKTGTTTKTYAVSAAFYDRLGPAIFAGINIYRPEGKSNDYRDWTSKMKPILQEITHEFAKKISPRSNEFI